MWTLAQAVAPSISPGTNQVLQQLTNQTYQQPLQWWMTYLFLGACGALIGVFWWSINRTSKAEDERSKMAIGIAQSIENGLEEDIRDIKSKLDKPHPFTEALREINVKLDRVIDLITRRR